MATPVRNQRSKRGAKPAPRRSGAVSDRTLLWEQWEHARQSVEWWRERCDRRGRTCLNRFGERVASVYQVELGKAEDRLLRASRALMSVGLAEKVEGGDGDGVLLKMVKSVE